MNSEYHVSAYYFGHPIYLTDKKDDDGVRSDWRYADTNEPLDRDNPRRCSKCNRYPTKEGHDPCIGNLPGVINACCGHGIEKAYIMFEDKRTIRGVFDIEND